MRSSGPKPAGRLTARAAVGLEAPPLSDVQVGNLGPLKAAVRWARSFPIFYLQAAILGKRMPRTAVCASEEATVPLWFVFENILSFRSRRCRGRHQAVCLTQHQELGATPNTNLPIRARWCPARGCGRAGNQTEQATKRRASERSDAACL